MEALRRRGAARRRPRTDPFSFPMTTSHFANFHLHQPQACWPREAHPHPHPMGQGAPGPGGYVPSSCPSPPRPASPSGSLRLFSEAGAAGTPVSVGGRPSPDLGASLRGDGRRGVGAQPPGRARGARARSGPGRSRRGATAGQPDSPTARPHRPRHLDAHPPAGTAPPGALRGTEGGRRAAAINLPTSSETCNILCQLYRNDTCTFQLCSNKCDILKKRARSLW